MATIDFVLAVVYSIAGSILAAYLIWLPVSAAVSAFAGRRGKSFLRKASLAVQRADSYIEDEKWADASRELLSAVVFDVVESRSLISALNDHHQNVLSRCLLLAESINAKPANIPALEKLLIERSQLLSLYSKSNEALKSLQNKRERAGKELPSWHRADFKKRTADIMNELKRNKRELSEELKTFFEELRAQSENRAVTYH